MLVFEVVDKKKLPEVLIVSLENELCMWLLGTVDSAAVQSD